MTIKRNVPLIDSNILISYFTEDNNYLKSKELLYQNRCYLNDYILCEILNYIQKKESNYHSVQVYLEIRDSEKLFMFLPVDIDLRNKANDIRKNI